MQVHTTSSGTALSPTQPLSLNIIIFPRLNGRDEMLSASNLFFFSFRYMGGDFASIFLDNVGGNFASALDTYIGWGFCFTLDKYVQGRGTLCFRWEGSLLQF